MLTTIGLILAALLLTALIIGIYWSWVQEGGSFFYWFCVVRPAVDLLGDMLGVVLILIAEIFRSTSD